MDINFPIFLHMLNRELRETERVYYSDFEIYKIIINLLCYYILEVYSLSLASMIFSAVIGHLSP